MDDTPSKKKGKSTLNKTNGGRVIKNQSTPKRAAAATKVSYAESEDEDEMMNEVKPEVEENDLVSLPF